MSTVVVDASVFINAFNPYEAGHEESRRLLSVLQDRAVPVIVPTLLLPEVSAAIGRGRDDAQLARDFCAALRRLPHIVWVSVDDSLAWQAAEIAAQHRLRRSDAVYAAVAVRFGATLATLDREQKERLSGVTGARYPAEMVAELSSS